jgi:hypothetical protein
MNLLRVAAIVITNRAAKQLAAAMSLRIQRRHFVADSTRGFTAEWNILRQGWSADRQRAAIYN